MAKRDWMVTESELQKDDIQWKVYMATLDKSCVVIGCAGSGKSVIALHKALRLQKEKGNDYKIIVFTKALCKYMNAGRKALGLNNEFFYHKEWKWKKELKRYANGQTFWVYSKDENGEKIPNKPSANYIIVDEIQDFDEEEIVEFIEATKSYFFFFGDSAQSIYGGIKKVFPVEDIRNLIVQNERKPKYFELYNNYRLPVPVARITQQYIGVDIDGYDEDVYKSKEVAIPRFIQYETIDRQVEAIANKIKEDTTLTDIGILLPNNNEVKQVSNMLNAYQINHELKYDDDDNFRNNIENLDFETSNPKVMTYHSAKGLQFETVFLPNVSQMSIDPIRRKSDQKALYVAMTRTCRDLFVTYSGIIPYPLSIVPPNLYKTSFVDQVEDI